MKSQTTPGKASTSVILPTKLARCGRNIDRKLAQPPMPVTPSLYAELVEYASIRGVSLKKCLDAAIDDYLQIHVD